MANGFLDTKKLDSAFEASWFEGYPILHNQLVIYINPKIAKSAKGALQVAKEKLEFVAARKSVNYILISDQPMVINGGFWFWVMTKREANDFMYCTNGSKEVQEWGFAKC
jgi:hypothetical protein